MSDTPRVDDDYPTYQATIPADLRQQIMSSRVPKNEREHWAAREIEKLEAENAELKKLVKQMREALEYALAEAWSTECERLIEAALSAAERGE